MLRVVDFPRIYLNISGPGDPSLYSCWASHTTWRTTAATSTIHTIYSSESVSWWSNPQRTATVNTCDGITRISGVPITTVTVTYPNATMLSTQYSSKPSPSCSITKQSDCTTLFEAYSSLSSSWMSSYTSNALAHSSSPRAVFSIGALTPPCTRDSDVKARECPASYSTAKSVDCRISASRPTVFYWPTQADICNSNNIASTVVSETATKTAIYNGATITSPTVLLVMSSVHAMTFSVDGTMIQNVDACDVKIGDKVSMFANPADLSSATRFTVTRTRPPTNVNITYVTSSASPQAFNFADLKSVPWHNYLNEKSCYSGYPVETFDSKRCPNTIWDDYNPVMYLPTSLKSLPGIPANCRLYETFFWPATYIPITADTVAEPTATRWGATANGNGITPTPMSGSRIQRDMPMETGIVG